jgi:hypothetical protein
MFVACGKISRANEHSAYHVYFIKDGYMVGDGVAYSLLRDAFDFVKRTMNCETENLMVMFVRAPGSYITDDYYFAKKGGCSDC